MLLIVIASAIWVYFDAKKLGAKRGLTKGFFDMGPGGWTAVVALLWIVGFPAYLIKRGEIKKCGQMLTPPTMPMAEGHAAPPVFKSQESTANNILQLEKLAELKSKGIITEEEFVAKKKQLLAS